MRFRLFNLDKAYISTISSSRNRRLAIRDPVIQLLNPHLNVYSENPSFRISKRWHVGHSHSDHGSGEDAEKIFRLGLVSDIGLAAGKALTGYLSGSTAIIADAAHSVSDVVLSGVALLSYKAARAPKDKEHPYGHGKFETLGALGISGALLVTGGGIAWHALDVLMVLLSTTPEIVNQSAVEHVNGHHHSHGIDMNHPILALNMAIVSIAVKEGLYWKTKRAGEKAGSGLMKANAWHHRADAISSVVALFGVGGSILGVKILDPFAGLLVSVMILKAGVETGYQSVLELVDAAISSQELDPFRETIQKVEGVKGCNHLRGRRAGSSLYLDVNIEVDPFISVSVAHEVGENVRRQIQNSHPVVAEVFIHIEPSFSDFIYSTKHEGTYCKYSTPLEHKDVEDIVHNMLESKFSKKMVVERITRHLLQGGKILLEIQVTMNPELLVREAINIAKEAEKFILEEGCLDVMQVCFNLQLGSNLLHSSS